MSKTGTLPRRLKVKPHCFLDGIIEDRRLGPGLYIESQNIDADSFNKLLHPKFEHAIEHLDSQPTPEPLAQVIDAPKSEPGIARLRQRRKEQDEAYKDRWPDGKPTQYTETR